MSKHFIEGNIEEFTVDGEIYKFKPVDANDELDWMDDFIDEKKTEKDGKEFITRKVNRKKLMICKFRNLIEVPFNQEELKKISGLEKAYKDYTNKDKDALYGKLHPDLFGLIDAEIKKIESHQKNV